MEKRVVSIADSFYLHTKPIGENFCDTCQAHKDFQEVMLGGPNKLSLMFLENAMCQ